MTLTGMGRYREALDIFTQARQLGKEYRTMQWLGRAIEICAGLHLTLGDFVKAAKLSEEARELGRAVPFAPVVASSGIDLLFNFTRHGEIRAAEKLLSSVGEDVAQTRSFHGWLTRLRFAQAQAEFALGRGKWDEAFGFAIDTIEQAHQLGRVKYEALGRQARAQALIALNRTDEAIADLHTALTLFRGIGDPALFLYAAGKLLTIAGDDDLLAEARSAQERITAAVPDDLRTIFLASEPVCAIARLGS
jgi:tetratricopeptide (TPR) repeat protein